MVEIRRAEVVEVVRNRHHRTGHYRHRPIPWPYKVLRVRLCWRETEPWLFPLRLAEPSALIAPVTASRVTRMTPDDLIAARTTPRVLVPEVSRDS